MNLRFVVVRVALRQLLHGLRIGHDAGAMVDLVKVGVHDGQRIQIVALALGPGANALALGDHDGAIGEIFRRRGDVGIPEHAERDPPIGDAALGIGLQHVLEYVLRRAVPERVLIQHSLVEKLLRLRLAGRFEIDGAELFRRRSAHAPAKCRPKASPQLQGLFSSRFSLLAASNQGGASRIARPARAKFRI